MIKEKICAKCDSSFPLSEYHSDKSKKDGVSSSCKKCKKVYRASYYTKNSERLKAESMSWFKENKERRAESSKQYYRENIDYFRACRKSRYWLDPKGNTRKSSDYHLGRIKSDPLYRFQARCRTRVYQALTQMGYRKASRAYSLIGCSRPDLVAMISAKFEPGMNWDNYGEWHIDHKIPISSAANQSETELLCHYLNMQPMWASANIAKSASFCAKEKAEMLSEIRGALEHSKD